MTDKEQTILRLYKFIEQNRGYGQGNVCTNWMKTFPEHRLVDCVFITSHGYTFRIGEVEMWMRSWF